MTIPCFSKKQEKGYVVVVALVFGGIFVGILYSLSGFVFTQHQAQRQARQSVEAVHVAEAGLDWYRWYLAHNPGDLDGPDDSEPFEKDITDPERGVVGTAELDISGNSFCGNVQTIDVRSTGWIPENSNITRTVRARYAHPSVAEYSYILNSNVWAGSDREIHGPYHSNGGIHMDGENDSLVTSAKEEWNCNDSYGCTGTKPGVFGDGSGDELWEFPVPQVDFEGITLDLNEIRSRGQQQGIYLGSAGGQSGKHGWHVVFNGDNTVDVYRVRNTEEVTAYNNQEGWHKNNTIIRNEKFDGTYTLPENCPVIFVEDRLWVEGEVSSKTTIAAAKAKNPNFQSSIVLNGNLTYSGDEAGLTVIAEDSIHIPLISPDQMELDGVFVAQNGRFGRDHYNDRHIGNSREEYINRNELQITGTIVSNGSVGTQWVDDSGNQISGYGKRVNSYDRNQALNPPPFTPSVSEEYEFVRWQEVRN